MPIEVDLKNAYRLLYDEKEPEKALELYDNVLQQSSTNLIALIYKAAALEKLYYSTKSWHSDGTLEEARGLLEKALDLAEQRGDRGKLALVNFRAFVYHFNRREYAAAEPYMTRAKQLGYDDATLGIWEANLEKKLKKAAAPGAAENRDEPKAPTEEPASAEQHAPVKSRMEWYQTTQKVTISLFVSKLPRSHSEVIVQVVNGKDLTVSYPITAGGSEFQYSLTLAHPVDSECYSVVVLTKKVEVVLQKKDSIHWKTLEDVGQGDVQSFPAEHASVDSAPSNSSNLQYPSSSRKKINWDALELDEAEDDQQSADAFFQSLYANADPDTKRAMMKSFLESGGTALNTDWNEVSKGRIEPSLPDGVEMKEF
ncbi:AAR138Cp [Eremothecium gossypii ATCC 10895]|uniref:AAR138Cp n=1 Tax=Eremothecium gossypii (strain ATCC 10895 / CBS 109.51 / FGSC 9923 / NRRL Y-1056) TaxID=284811 RepID=Q75EE3_EREGS|nr:AAR138Cp [Eremothecium gossypii ATCC 10895]AAS50504.1 AAR138Cp [Eremothecium gossypii ATCC 10895]AEY94791.1 FAAR138Cp [Eremothecium gossypii FDAG1]